MIWRVLFAVLLTIFARPVLAREAYATKGQCDGVPRLMLKTPSGLCVGLLARHLGFPRGLALIGSDVYVADLASRTPGRGRILRLANFGRGTPEVVLSGLNQPNGLAVDGERRLYVGEVGRIVRFDPRATDPRATIAVIVDRLPEDGRHNLTAFVIAPDGALIVGIGARSDNCETASGARPAPFAACPETLMKPPRGALIRIDPNGSKPLPASAAQVYAVGIRNAMAFALLPDGGLLAASNGRDNIDTADPRLPDATLPHDELLRIERGGRYGWPYCFDGRRPSPEYPQFDCKTRTAPIALLSAHAAPLAMLHYTGARMARLTGKLILAYHGYRALGHRIVALSLNADGRPGPETEVVSGWGSAAGHPMGSPAALLQLPDGSVLIAEDRNRTLLRLSTP